MWDHIDPRTRESSGRSSPGRGGRSSTDARERSSRERRDAFTEGLDLPRGRTREDVSLGDETFKLRGSEVRALATIGAFRVVPIDDIRDDANRPGDLRHGDLERLRESGLIRSVAPLDRDQPTRVVTLTDKGRALLEAHRDPHHEHVQSFHADVLRPRELTHDAQVYRAFERAMARQAEREAQLLRVVLEHDLKREYQRFLQEPNRGQHDADGRVQRTDREIRGWADEHELSVRDGHVQFPDLRLELETSDGRREVEDIEVTTLHYRGLHASGKASAGFTRYRSAGGRVGGSGGRRGGSRGGSTGGRRSPGPHLAEEFLQ
jgi:DNA-binding PadR family transcriptional regulator